MNLPTNKLIVACAYSCIVLAFALILICLSLDSDKLYYFKIVVGSILAVYGAGVPVIFAYIENRESNKDKAQSSSPVPSMTEEKVRQIINEVVKPSTNDAHIDEIKKVYKDCFNYLTRNNQENNKGK